MEQQSAKKGEVIGYARVSTVEQNIERQLVALESYGADKIYIDKLSGKDTNRPQLQKMLEYLREGDTLVISEYSRLARSTQDLLQLVKQLTDKGVKVVSIKENFDTSTPQGEFILTMFAGLAELERKLTLQRQAEGIAIAKAQGKYKGRQPIPYDADTFHRECKKWLAGQQTATQTMKKLQMKPNRFYRIAKELGYKKIGEKEWIYEPKKSKKGEEK